MNFSWRAFAMATIVCCGCASAPVHYYSLTPASKSPSQTKNATCCIVEMKKVTVPVEVDRPELVARRNDEELDVLSNDVWLAPLPDEIRGALLAEIRRGLLDAAIAGATAATRRFHVVVDVQRFESVLADHALIQAQWRIEAAESPKPAAPVACETTANIAVAVGIPALIQGHQRAIAQIADRIVANVLELNHSEAMRCVS